MPAEQLHFIMPCSLKNVIHFLYIDDVLKSVADSDTGCRLGIMKINIIAYADDIAVLTDSQGSLENLCLMIENKLNGLDLEINRIKSKVIIFNEGRSQVQGTTPTHINGYKVVKKFTYLGHVILDNLLDTEDVDSRLVSFYAGSNSVFRNFNNINSHFCLSRTVYRTTVYKHGMLKILPKIRYSEHLLQLIVILSKNI